VSGINFINGYINYKTMELHTYFLVVAF